MADEFLENLEIGEDRRQQKHGPCHIENRPKTPMGSDLPSGEGASKETEVPGRHGEAIDPSGNRTGRDALHDRIEARRQAPRHESKQESQRRQLPRVTDKRLRKTENTGDQESDDENLVRSDEPCAVRPCPKGGQAKAMR